MVFTLAVEDLKKRIADVKLVRESRFERTANQIKTHAAISNETHLSSHLFALLHTNDYSISDCMKISSLTFN